MTDTTRNAVAADTPAPESGENADTAPVEQDETTEQTAETAEEAGEESAPSKEDSGEDSAGESQPKKKGGGFQKRIDRLTTEKYEAEFKARQALQQLEELQRRLAPPEAKNPGDMPQLEDFKTLEEFQKAVTDWNRATADYARQEAIKEAEQSRKAREAEVLAVQAQARLNARLEQTQRKYADFDQVVAPIAPIVDGDQAIHDFMMESETAGELSYHLAKNPAELIRLTQLQGVAKLRELIKLEERVAAPEPAKPLTKAPPPIKPVGSNESPRLSLEDLPMTEYVKRMNAEERKRRG